MSPSEHTEKTVSTTIAQQVCIATYNTKNLFNSQHPDHPKRPREFRELARMIGKIDADILALQEVGQPPSYGGQAMSRPPPPFCFGGAAWGGGTAVSGLS